LYIYARRFSHGRRIGVKNRIREFRVARLWSQERLARKARVHYSTISRLESGLREATPLIQERIARALEVPRQDVFPIELEEASA
jgi:transcriptional regulator with XRE-family HTH domain